MPRCSNPKCQMAANCQKCHICRPTNDQVQIQCPSWHIPPNLPSNVRVQNTSPAYYWFRQSPWWLNHQSHQSQSRSVINSAHSTQKYSSPHANLNKYLMRHTSHAHLTKSYSTPHANLTKYLTRHTSHAHSTQSYSTPHADLTKYLMRPTSRARSDTNTNFTLQKTNLKTTFPKSCHRSGNKDFK